MFERFNRIKEFKDKLENMTLNSANNSIKEFFDEYFRQQEIINQKLSETIKNGYEKEHNWIMEYKQDLDLIAKKFGELAMESNKIKLFRAMPKIFNKLGEMKRKYKEEDCNIDNFKV
jgi:glucose-6-phosphate isomerase